MKHIIIGFGEVGKALHNIFPEAHVFDRAYVDSNAEDMNTIRESERYDVMHICFPYSKNFIEDVVDYKLQTQAPLVIIHSSVPIGTCDILGAVHSPIRGVHPHLSKGIRTFVKYFGGMKALEAAQLFSEKGIECQIIRDSRTTEALKLWDTTQYGVMILLEKEIHKFCRENGLDFEVVYASANASYNQGYTDLGMPHVVRPQLMHAPGKIGGHCVVQNAKLLDTPSAKRIIRENTQL